MNGAPCCKARPPGPASRAVRAVKWFVPSVLLALLPKCPACLAAYLAVSGIGVSTATAAGLRTGLLVVCVGALVVLVVRLIRSRIRTGPAESNLAVAIEADPPPRPTAPAPGA